MGRDRRREPAGPYGRGAAPGTAGCAASSSGIRCRSRVTAGSPRTTSERASSSVENRSRPCTA